jgi:hypothetical protein
MVFLNESSYLVEITYDAIYDDYCFFTLYRFESDDLAQQFNEYIDSLQNICSSNIQFEKKRDILGYTDLMPYRPRFNVLTDAIDDLRKFINCCNSYFIMEKNEQLKLYKYAENIFIEPIEKAEKIYFIKEIKSLKKEIECLKKENDELKSQLILNN